MVINVNKKTCVTFKNYECANYLLFSAALKRTYSTLTLILAGFRNAITTSRVELDRARACNYNTQYHENLGQDLRKAI